MIITDLDGTLLNSEGKLSDKDRETLIRLGERKMVRVVATGRILHSAMLVLDKDFPIDYLVFSSGAGVLDFKNNQLLHANFMERDDVFHSLEIVEKLDLNFMLHGPVPDNHFCICRRGGEFDHKDFDHRLSNYREFAHPYDEHEVILKKWNYRASLIVCSVPFQEGEPLYYKLKEVLPKLHIVRNTSPLDPNYHWVEILPLGVSKASGCQWLLEHLNRPTERNLGVGNDFNDVDLLEWVDAAFVVENAPKELLDKYKVVSDHKNSGFSHAVERFLKSK